MKILTTLYEKYFDDAEKDKRYSNEFIVQRNKCIKLYDELSATLNKVQKKKLRKLDSEYFMLGGILEDNGIEEGIENGFKLMIKLLIQSLSQIANAFL